LLALGRCYFRRVVSSSPRSPGAGWTSRRHGPRAASAMRCPSTALGLPGVTRTDHVRGPPAPEETDRPFLEAIAEARPPPPFSVALKGGWSTDVGRRQRVGRGRTGPGQLLLHIRRSPGPTAHHPGPDRGEPQAPAGAGRYPEETRTNDREQKEIRRRRQPRRRRQKARKRAAIAAGRGAKRPSRRVRRGVQTATSARVTTARRPAPRELSRWASSHCSSTASRLRRPPPRRRRPARAAGLGGALRSSARTTGSAGRSARGRRHGAPHPGGKARAEYSAASGEEMSQGAAGGRGRCRLPAALSFRASR